MQPLTDRHLQMLRDESAITSELIAARGYYSLHTGNGTIEALAALGFDHKQTLGVSHGDVLVIPVCPPDGSDGAVMVRPDVPRTFDKKDKKLPDGTHPQQVLKYEQPKGAANRLDVNPLRRAQLLDPYIDLWITEGVKKGDALASAGLCAVALPGGVYGFMASNNKGASTVTADLDHIAWKSKKDGTRRRVFIVFDSDVMSKDPVKQALRRLSAILTNRGAYVVPVVLPSTPDGGKQGVDDFLAAGGTVTQLYRLAATSELSLTVLAGPGSKRLKTEDYIQTLAGLGYSFRMNDLDDTVECNGEPLTDATVARIKSHLRDHGIDTVNIAEDAWTAYASVNRYHPIKDYLNGLEWDGENHLGRLLGYFEDSERTDKHPCPVFGTYLKHWLIGAVAKAMDPGTHNQNAMLVLEGAQRIGKSHFAAWLANPCADYFVESSIHPDDKDNRLALASRWIWEVLELSSTTRRADVDALKGFITTAWVSERKPYGHYPIRKPALTSFIGTVNMSGAGGFLVDDTGNRRFYTVTVTKISRGYSKAVDVNQLWAQAVALWRKGETWQLSESMAGKQAELNRRYEAETDILDWLLQYYEITHNPDDFEGLPGMAAKLQESGYRGGSTAVISREIRKALAREGLRETQRRIPEGKPRGYEGIKTRFP